MAVSQDAIRAAVLVALTQNPQGFAYFSDLLEETLAVLKSEYGEQAPKQLFNNFFSNTLYFLKLDGLITYEPIKKKNGEWHKENFLLVVQPKLDRNTSQRPLKVKGGGQKIGHQKVLRPPYNKHTPKAPKTKGRK